MAIITNTNKTRVQFYNAQTKKSKAVNIHGLDFNKIYDNTTYFLEQLITYPEIKLICYGGEKNDKKTINERRNRLDNEEPEQAQNNAERARNSNENNQIQN